MKGSNAMNALTCWMYQLVEFAQKPEAAELLAKLNERTSEMLVLRDRFNGEDLNSPESNTIANQILQMILEAEVDFGDEIENMLLVLRARKQSFKR